MGYPIKGGYACRCAVCGCIIPENGDRFPYPINRRLNVHPSPCYQIAIKQKALDEALAKRQMTAKAKARKGQLEFFD